MQSTPDLGLSVREALSSDAPRIAMLARQLGYDVPLAHVETLLAQNTREWQVFVAVVARVGVVGWVTVGVHENLTTSRSALIEGFVVDQEYRSVGIGTALLERVEQWARVHRCPEIALLSNVVREGARKFYERHGYSVIKTSNRFNKSL